MGRRGRSDRGQRDAIEPSLDALLAPAIEPVRPISAVSLIPPREAFREVEDGRQFAPSVRSPRSFAGASSQIGVVAPRGRTRDVPAGVAFSHPEHVVRCVRRKERREVIFALRKRRKGSGARRRRRNFWSEVKC